MLFGLKIKAQIDLGTSSAKLKNSAESALLVNDYYSAIYYLEQFVAREDKDVKERQQLAQLYLTARNFEKAKSTFFSLLSQKKNINEYYFYLGIIHQQTGNYDSSLFYLEQCQKTKLPATLKKRYPLIIKGVKIALKQGTDTSTITINHLSKAINHEHMDYAPAFINDSTLFYSTIVLDDDNNQTRGQILQLDVKNNQWKLANEPPIIASGTDVILGNGCISLSKSRYYFTQCFSNWQNKMICNLYVSQVENNEFGAPQKLESEINDLFFTTTQPTVGTTYNPDIEVIYFVSDRPGGIGGMDIWYTVYNKKTNRYQQPKNAGPKINTPWDEITPYYQPTTKTLYFSSNGRPSFGGFDVYKSTGELRSWFEPVNAGNYINTHADELGYVLNSRQTGGFFVSNRMGSQQLFQEYCCYDIYNFSFKNPGQLNLKGKLKVQLNTTIKKLLKYGVEFRDSFPVDAGLEDATVSLYLKDADNSDSLYIATDTTDSKGNYNFNVGKNQNYSLIIHDKNEIKEQIEVSTYGNNNRASTDIVIENTGIETLPDAPLIIKNIYYEFGKSNLTPRAQQRIDSTLFMILKELPSIKIEISSFTDNKGSAEFNLKLSRERAQNVAHYLMEKGISDERLVPKGYGENFPVAPNTHPDGTDNPAGREKNRRTEFKILGEFEPSAIQF